MSRTTRYFLFLLLALACLAAAGILTYQQLLRYNQQMSVFPPGSTLADIPVGGLDASAAQECILLAYVRTPVELLIDGSPVQFPPEALGQRVDVDGMFRATAMIQSQRPYWSGFLDFLFNRLPAPLSAPLACAVSEETLRAYLNDQLAPRYQQPPTPGFPIAGDVLFQAGQPGQVLDLESAIAPLKTALCAREARVVNIHTNVSGPLPPTLDTLEPMLETLVQVSGFDGLIELYFEDIQSGRKINFAVNQHQPVPPGIAFTAASTIKIPVMVSALKQVDGTLPEDVAQKMALMIDLSDNESTDAVMQRVLDPNIAPVQVTQDMQAIGLKNTFLAGFFYPGAALLDSYHTPANQRTDLTTDPDIYNQTTSEDMGRLLAAIQHCAAKNSGPLVSAFEGKITKEECLFMLDLLAKNRKGVLIEVGMPEGTRIAHKYGWVTDSVDGLMHTASDAAIVYTPTGDFVLTVYLYHPDQLQWDEAQRLVGRLATGISNFYRAQSQN